MSESTVRLLLIHGDVERDTRFRSVLDCISDLPLAIDEATSLNEGIARLSQEDREVVLLDLASQNGHTLESLRKTLVVARETPVIVLSDAMESDMVRDVLQEGAHDCLVKSETDAGLLGRSIRHGVERKRVVHTLRESEERYRKFFRDDLTADFITTAEGRIIDCNPAFVRLFGFDSYEHALRSSTRQIYPRKGNRGELMELLRERRRLDGIELELCRLDGTPVHVIENIVGNFDQNGELVTLQGYIFDITERVQLEHQLRHVQKMEAMGRLAGGVAHDFNNLLTVIMGQAQLLARQLPENGDQARSLSEISHAAERAASLTRQLLAFSRRQVLELRVLDLNEVNEGMVRMLERLIGETVELDMQPAADLWPVKADPGQIEQVIMNLVVNARDAMPSGGTVTIRTANVEQVDTSASRRAGRPRGRCVKLSVRDSGSGIDEKTLARIFEPFFTTKELGRGTGLGLAMVYGIIEQSGGCIDVETEVGRGTEFIVHLPCTRGRAKRSEVPRRKVQAARGDETILLVEDEDAVRRMVRETLAAAGYRVLEAQDGRRAIEIIESPQPIDLVLTDVVMPVVSGTVVAEAARTQRPGIRVLFMSGYTADEIVRPQDDPATGMIPKPFTPEALAAKLRELLES